MYRSFWFTKELMGRLKAAAARESRTYPNSVTVSDLVRRFIEDGLERLRKDGRG